MTSSLLNVDGAALLVTDFLPAADLFSLHAYRIPKKKLYLAFTKRWVMPPPGDRKERQCIPWVRPEKKKRKEEETMEEEVATDDLKEMNGQEAAAADALQNANKSAGESKGNVALEDSKTIVGDGSMRKKKKLQAKGLVFIGRVGCPKHPLSCVPLRMKGKDKSQSLVYDKEAMYRIPIIAEHCRRVPPLLLPQDARLCELLKNVKGYGEEGYEDWKEDVRDAMRGSFDLTLHVINVRTCQVISLQTFGHGTYGPYVYKGGAGDWGSVEPSYCSLDLYGVPPRYSPKYRVFTDEDFRKLGDAPWEHDDYPPIEEMTVYGEFEMQYTTVDDGTMELRAGADDISFSFGDSFTSKKDVRHFFRAIIDEKCGASPSTRSPPSMEQPSWVQSDTIVDAVTQYASFEDQAGKLRLVCHQFQSSALRQLEQKIRKVKVIGALGRFKATVRHGWSEYCLTDEKSVVDDALWLASCRCKSNNPCKNKGSCPTASEPPKFCGYQVKGPASLNMNWARKALAENGRIRLTEDDPDDLSYKGDCYVASNVVECSFEQSNMTIFQLCDKVERIIRKKTRTEYAEWEDEPVALSGKSRRDYKVSGQITTRQFVRSLSLLFANANAAEADESEAGRRPSKKARLANVGEVSVGYAKTNISGSRGSFARMMKIYRFYSASNEQIEICLENRSNYRYFH